MSGNTRVSYNDIGTHLDIDRDQEYLLWYPLINGVGINRITLWVICYNP